MRINKNMFSLNIFRNYNSAVKKSGDAVNKISSGQKILSAKDNPNKIGQNEKLKLSILSTQRAETNIQDTNSMLQTFDGALNEISDSLNRVRELTVRANNGSLTDEDRNAAQAEADEILNGVKDIVTNTEFNGVKMTTDKVNGTDSVSIKSQVGAMDGDTMDVPVFNLSLDNLGLTGLKLGEDGKDIQKVDNAIDIILNARSNTGALQNALESKADEMSANNVVLQKAQSAIGDSDVAKEYSTYCTQQILFQSSIALMAQANKLPEDALQYIGNIPRG